MDWNYLGKVAHWWKQIEKIELVALSWYSRLNAQKTFEEEFLKMVADFEIEIGKKQMFDFFIPDWFSADLYKGATSTEVEMMVKYKLLQMESLSEAGFLRANQLWSEGGVFSCKWATSTRSESRADWFSKYDLGWGPPFVKSICFIDDFGIIFNIFYTNGRPLPRSRWW